jgi:hypothetical protein
MVSALANLSVINALAGMDTPESRRMANQLYKDAAVFTVMTPMAQAFVGRCAGH